MIPFSEDDLLRHLGGVYLQRGRAYQRAGKVKVEEIAGDHVLGRVQGGAGRPYSVRATVTEKNGRARVFGVCSCPMSHDCKHVAALLLEVLSQRAAPPPAAPPLAALPLAERGEVPPPLSFEVSRWLGNVAQAIGGDGEDYPPGVLQRLWYVLAVTGHLQPMTVRLRKDGSVADARPYNLANINYGSGPAKYLRPSDRVILRTMLAQGGAPEGLSGEAAAELLQRVLATGRCHWGDVGGPVLGLGPERPGRLSWQLGDDGRLRQVLDVDADEALAYAPPFYVDAGRGLCGPIATGLAPRLAEELLKAPAVPAAEAAAVRARLGDLLPGREELLPPELAPPRRVEGPPKPKLRLHAREVPQVPASHAWRAPPPTVVLLPLARLTFLYDDVELSDRDHRPPVETVSRDGTLVEVHREVVFEDHCADRLIAYGFARLRHHRGYIAPPDCGDDRIFRGGTRQQDFAEFCLTELPRLRAEGWIVEADQDFPVPLEMYQGALEVSLDQTPDADWFDLQLGAMVDGRRVDILPALLKLLRQPGAAETLAGRPVALRLDDGKVIAVPGERLAPIAGTLLELFADEPPGQSRLHRRRAAELAGLEAAGGGAIVWQGGEAVREMGRLLRDHRGLPTAAVPPGFHGTLRQYQRDGLNWMQFLRMVGLGGILADDMGLGKTVQVLAHLSVEQAEGRLDRPCLVVAPTSLMPNWRREAATFAPGLKVLVLHGADRKASFDALAGYDLVLTTYPLIARDIEVLSAQPWHMVIADEAQFVKNPDALAAKALRRLEARHKLCLTGTPVENHLGELWTLFDFVSPGLLGDRRGFARGWRAAIERENDAGARESLVRRVRPFLLRRTKGQVAAELPPKTEIVESIEMAAAQRDLYEGIRLAMHEKVRAVIASKGLARSRIDFLDALLKLRQACCDPRLVKGSKKIKGSAKLERLMEMLPELVEEGRRILLFSQFTSMLDLIQPELDRAGLTFVRLTGDTRDRDTPVRRFQAGEVPLFLISLKAGGTGLNLTAADTVIHYDPWWNPAAEAQATDRAHRIGQDKPVFVHKLITQGTVEEKILALQARKAALAAAVFDSSAKGPLGLSDEDVEYLLGG